MPMRFSTQAANADVMGEDAGPDSSSDTDPRTVAQGRPRSRFTRSPSPDDKGGKSGNAEDSEGKPGKDINAPGFLKDKDSDQP